MSRCGDAATCVVERTAFTATICRPSRAGTLLPEAMQ